MPNLVTTAEVAKRKGVDVRTIHRMVERGELTPVVKGTGVRGAMFFDPADIDAEQVAS